MKQEKQDQEHDMCEIRIQQYFIAKKKQNEVMTTNCTQNECWINCM
jgi:hypothetical protein